MILPDQFIDQDTPENMYKVAGLDAEAIEQKAIDTLKSNIVIPKSKKFS
jgi:1-deoxy-D-xylulose-5-phosphate synthase